MDLKRKLELCTQSIRSISRADDDDMAVRAAGLDAVQSLIDAEKRAMTDRVQSQIDTALGKAKA